MRDLRVAFILKFFVALFLSMAAISSGAIIDHLRLPYCRVLAISCGYAFQLLGISTTISRRSLFHEGEALTVIPECDGTVLICLFLAAAVAVPVWKLPERRRSALFAGLVAILVLVRFNWIRVMLLATTSFFRPDLYDVVHDFVLQGVLIFATVGVFLVWAERLYEHPHTVGAGT